MRCRRDSIKNWMPTKRIEALFTRTTVTVRTDVFCCCSHHHILFLSLFPCTTQAGYTNSATMSDDYRLIRRLWICVHVYFGQCITCSTKRLSLFFLFKPQLCMNQFCYMPSRYLVWQASLVSGKTDHICLLNLNWFQLLDRHGSSESEGNFECRNHSLFQTKNLTNTFELYA